MSRKQRPISEKLVVCNACQRDDCPNCLDVMRAVSGLPPKCPCKRKGHTGEIGDRHPDDPVADDLVIRHMEDQFDD